MTVNNGNQAKKTRLRAAFVAALFVSASPIALHAETSNAQLAKEIAELKAQIHAMRGAIAETRTETRRVAKRAPSTVVAAAPSYAALPEGATPVFVTATKQMQFGSLTITPGGFVDMIGVYRNKNLNAETSSPVNSIPTNNLQNAHYGENRLSARNTRVALLVESPISANMLVAGYGELDFRASGVTGSPGQTSGFSPRVRQLYTTLDNNELGLHFLAGQAWSLVTANSKGITPRNELTPPTIDNVVLPGFSYGRTPQIRLTKDFNKKLWVSLAAEAGQISGVGSGACAASAAGGAFTGTGFTGAAIPAVPFNPVTGAAAIPAVAAGGAVPAVLVPGLLTAGNCATVATAGDFGGDGVGPTISLNRIPNVIGKVAYEANIFDRNVHVEATGLFKEGMTYVDSIGGTAQRQTTPMGGVGANISFPIIVGKLDLQAGGNYGSGFGFYTSSGLPDATVGQDGKIRALKGESGYAGVIAHLTPAIDVYAFGGVDQVERNFTQVGNVQAGYGTTFGNNSGCNTLGSALCTGQTHRIYQLTGGFSDKLYKGAFGEVRASAQYSYTKRDLFSVQTTAAAPMVGASADEHIVFTSLKYFPFQ